MAKKNISVKEALKKAFVDTLKVVAWSGVPATGVVGLLVIVGEDVPAITRYAPYIATLFNTFAFFVKKFVEYKWSKS